MLKNQILYSYLLRLKFARGYIDRSAGTSQRVGNLLQRHPAIHLVNLVNKPDQNTVYK